MKKNAFTLIELLVVIAIIALLLGILLPSLMTAKEQARGVYCRNNMKQMCLAAASYTLDNDDYYPIAHYTKTVSQPVASANLFNGLHFSAASTDERSQEIVTYSYCWDFTTIKNGDVKETIPGTLWQGETIGKVQQCPSYKGSDNWKGNSYTGYNYNTSYIGHGEGEAVGRGYTGGVKSLSGKFIVFPAKASFVNNPTSCVLFGDGHWANGANKFMRSPMTWKGDTEWNLRVGGTQGFRHNRQTNIGWADGHVNNQKELYTETHPKYKLSLDSYNRVNKTKIGFISSSNNLYDLE